MVDDCYFKYLSSAMGMYQLTTSPEKDILPDNADIFWEYTGDSEPNPWGRPKLDLKEPDNCDDDPNSTDCAEDSTAFINVINTFENGSATIDVPSFAARAWLQAMTSDGDAEKSLYFYTQKTTIPSTRVSVGRRVCHNSPEFRCFFVKLADPDGWVPNYIDCTSRTLISCDQRALRLGARTSLLLTILRMRSGAIIPS